MTSARRFQRAPEERGGSTPPRAVARVRVLGVVEVQEGRERLLELATAGEVPAAELDAPALLQQDALEPLDVELFVLRPEPAKDAVLAR